MSPGVLAWDLVLARRTAVSLEEVSARIGSAIADALCGFSIAAYFRPPGEVVVGDRKISGSAGWHDGSSLIHQGTVLVDADLDEMASALRILSDGTPLPVMTLADGTAALPCLEEVADALTVAIAQALDRQARFDRLSAQEADLALELLAEEIGTEDFIEGEAVSNRSAATTSLPA
jgi:lipoate-protein ligase A